MIRPVESTLSDDEHDEDDDNDDDDSTRKHYAFPDLDSLIRQCVKEYEAVFPKLNFSSPKVCVFTIKPHILPRAKKTSDQQDAAWLLPASSPLKCTSPADVYLLLKSSDFINHDLDVHAVFEGCQFDADGPPTYDLELVLRKWYPVDRGRELRCFVRANELIGERAAATLSDSISKLRLLTRGMVLGISQRDTNYYEFWNDPETQRKVSSAVREFWETNIKPKWMSCHQDCMFNLKLIHYQRSDLIYCTQRHFRLSPHP